MTCVQMLTNVQVTASPSTPAQTTCEEARDPALTLYVPLAGFLLGLHFAEGSKTAADPCPWDRQVGRGSTFFPNSPHPP